jgi:hypothetical protein
MAFNIASQLLGSAKGHEVNAAVDVPFDGVSASITKLAEDFAKSAAATELQSLGITPTLEGVAEFVDAKIESAVASSNLSDQAKADIKSVLDGLFAIVKPDIPVVEL